MAELWLALVVLFAGFVLVLVLHRAERGKKALIIEGVEADFSGVREALLSMGFGEASSIEDGPVLVVCLGTSLKEALEICERAERGTKILVFPRGGGEILKLRKAEVRTVEGGGWRELWEVMVKNRIKTAVLWDMWYHLVGEGDPVLVSEGRIYTLKVEMEGKVLLLCPHWSFISLSEYFGRIGWNEGDNALLFREIVEAV